MKALSIRQPWAWLIMNGGKDVENRSWNAKLRGRFLVHAAKGMNRREYVEALEYAAERVSADVLRTFPTYEQVERGGIIGTVELVDSVYTSDSPWYMGQKAFVLRDPKPLPFLPYKGQLGFFTVPDALLAPVTEITA